MTLILWVGKVVYAPCGMKLKAPKRFPAVAGPWLDKARGFGAR